MLLAWAGSLRAPFEFDDHPSILTNPTIRHLWPADWARPPATAGETVGGRPVLNFTFALNYAVGGLDVRGYRLGNLLVHAGAAFLLWAILRRISAVGGAGVALAAATLWAVHPLQTAAVTYVVQRAESLAAFFALLSVYAFLRFREPGARRAGWGIACVGACLLAFGTKESVAALPLLILLADRAFFAGSFRAAWRENGKLHAALAAAWLVLAALVLTNPGRGGSAGLHAAIPPGIYLLTQAAALARYAGLMVWPAGQVFDYGVPIITDPAAVVVPGLFILLLVGRTVWDLTRNRPEGVAGAWCLLLLAPSSSFVPVATQTMAEHRLYLALAAPLVVACAWTRCALQRKAYLRGWGGFVAAALVVALGAATVARNRVYASEQDLWADTVAKRPANPRAHYNLGRAFREAGRRDEAAAEFRRTLELQPNHAFAHFQLGALALEAGRPAEAIPSFEAALAADPGYVDARVNLGQSLLDTGRTDEAIAQLQRALADEPGAADIRAGLIKALYDRANGFARQQRFGEALAGYDDVLRLDPAHVPARNNLANSQLALGRFDDAIANYEAVLQLRPGDAAVERNLALARELRAR